MHSPTLDNSGMGKDTGTFGVTRPWHETSRLTLQVQVTRKSVYHVCSLGIQEGDNPVLGLFPRGQVSHLLGRLSRDRAVGSHLARLGINHTFRAAEVSCRLSFQQGKRTKEFPMVEYIFICKLSGGALQLYLAAMVQALAILWLKDRS